MQIKVTKNQKEEFYLIKSDLEDNKLYECDNGWYVIKQMSYLILFKEKEINIAMFDTFNVSRRFKLTTNSITIN